MLLRFFISPMGRISANRYRAFLMWYFLGVLPAMMILFMAFMVLGWRGGQGILRTKPSFAVIAGAVFYTLAALWPFVAATIRRMHDLNYHFWSHFFILSPRKTFRLANDLLFKRGHSGRNLHGDDPGSFE
jgi:uncharacterized membrane protein YhaH (DUF805 family)